MRRQPGISLYHPPARRPTALRRYGAFAAIGLLAGATVGLGLTQMPVGQVTAITPASDKECDSGRQGNHADAARCASARAQPKSAARPARCATPHRCPDKLPRARDVAP